MIKITRVFYSTIIICILGIQSSVYAENNTKMIPFDTEHWNFVGATKVEDYKGKKALVLASKDVAAPMSFGLAVAKNIAFREHFGA